MRFPKSVRVRRGHEIRAVLRRGKRKRTPRLDVYVLVGAAARARVGWIVPKLGHPTSARNLVKRRLKEIARTKALGRIEAASAPADVLVRVRREAYRATYRQLEADFVNAVEEMCSPRR